MKKTRVLHVIPTLQAGGAEKLIDDLLPLFDKEKYEVELFVISLQDSFFIHNIYDNGIKVHTGVDNRIKSFRNLKALQKLIKYGDYKIVHGHLFPVNYWLSFISVIRPNIKYVVTEHNTHNRRRNFRFFRPIERLVYGRFNKIISISAMTQINLMRWLRIRDSKNFIVINNGINIDKFANAEPYSKSSLDKGISEDDFLILMVGSFTKQKDQNTIIRSIKNLPKNIKLILVGTGNRIEESKTLTENLKLTKRVFFLGLRNDVERINKTSDVIVVSSNWEGFGLVAAEGMASGKPVIASNVQGLREIVGEHGILFEPQNHEDLESQILNLYENKNIEEEYMLKSKIGGNQYSIEKMLERYVMVYDKL